MEKRPVVILSVLAGLASLGGANAKDLSGLLGRWTSLDADLGETIDAGKELGDELSSRLSSWFGDAAKTVADSSVPDTIKARVNEEVAQFYETTGAPPPDDAGINIGAYGTVVPEDVVDTRASGSKWGPPPSETEENWIDRAWAAAENPPADPQPGFIYTRIDRTATNAVGQQVPVISMWRYVKRDKNGLVLSSLANSKQTTTVTREELDDNYKYFYEDKDRLLRGSGRKTRRARGKKRRTVKRRAKSLRRRRQ